MAHVDLNKYQEFVKAVTSEPSNRIGDFTSQVQQLTAETGINIPLLLTGAIGLSSEGGEFSEIVKKCVFQGKTLDDDTVYHAKRELGDIMWYWINSCRALGVDPNEVITENVRKLEARYPNGEFDVFYSENRQNNDL